MLAPQRGLELRESLREGVVGALPVAQVGPQHADRVQRARGLRVGLAQRLAADLQGLAVRGLGRRKVPRHAVGVAAQVQHRRRRRLRGAERRAVALESALQVLERAARRAQAQRHVPARLLELGAQLLRAGLAFQGVELLARLIEVAQLRRQARQRDAQLHVAALARDLAGGARGAQRLVGVAELELDQRQRLVEAHQLLGAGAPARVLARVVHHGQGFAVLAAVQQVARQVHLILRGDLGRLGLGLPAHRGADAQLAQRALELLVGGAPLGALGKCLELARGLLVAARALHVGEVQAHDVAGVVARAQARLERGEQLAERRGGRAEITAAAVLRRLARECRGVGRLRGGERRRQQAERGEG